MYTSIYFVNLYPLLFNQMIPATDIFKIATEEQLSDIPTSDFLEIILSNTQLSDIAMYYLLQKRINHKLRMRYDVYENQLTDKFEDITGDFFLYLRDGNDMSNNVPYQSLRSIKKKDSFEAWIKNTFRNYLSNKIDNSTYKPVAYKIDASPLTDETILDIASKLITYTHQELSPKGRFIFLRTLLSLLNRKNAMPDKDVAEVIGMTYTSYRVMVHRIKDNLINLHTRILKGELMATRIYDDFTNLYPTLFNYYNNNIEMSEYREQIISLRNRYYDSTGNTLHESTATYLPSNITPAIFLSRLNKLLLYTD